MFQGTSKIPAPVFIAALMISILLPMARVQGAEEAGQNPANPIWQDTMKQETMQSKHMTSRHEIAGREGFLQSLDDLVGTKIENPQGQQFGKVEGLIIDPKQEQVCYVVLSSKDKMYPVPWSAIDTGTKTYTLDLTPEKMMQAPSMESVDMALLKSPNFVKKTGDFYSSQIAGHEKEYGMMEKTGQPNMPMMSESARLVTCSQLIGMKINNSKGERLADLEDILFDVRGGNLAYGLVSYGGLWGIGEDTSAVPWSALTVNPSQGVATVNADRDMLKESMIKRDQFAKLNESPFASKVYQTYNQEPYWEVFGYVPPSGEMVSMTAWQADSQYNQCFDPKTVATFEGTIKSIGSFRPEKGTSPGLRLKIETTDNQPLTVYAGPRDFYKMQNFKLENGDKVTVTGSKTKFDDKSIIMAETIKISTQTLKLRDDKGAPLWNTDMMQQHIMRNKEMHQKGMMKSGQMETHHENMMQSEQKPSGMK